MASAAANLAQRVLAQHRRQPLLSDGLLVAVLLGVGLRAGRGEPIGATSQLFTVALLLPLLGRRRWPVAVFALMASTAAVQWLVDVRAFGDAGLLVALFTVAVQSPLRTTLAAYAVIEIGAALAAARWAGADVVRAFVGLSGLATAATVMATSTRNRRALVASLEERAERLEVERDQQGRLAAAAERARIAREMHDIVAHNVSVMIALADGASYAVRQDPGRAEHAMLTASRTGRQALSEMRRLLGILHDDAESPQLAPQPGLAQLEDLVQDVRTAGLPVAYELQGSPEATLPGGLQLAVFRIAQEALTNTLKHAGPGAVAEVRLQHRPDLVELEVVDRGGTPPVASAAASPGAGLRGMGERAAVYRGALEAGPSAEGGWRVRLRVPLGQPAGVA